MDDDLDEGSYGDRESMDRDQEYDCSHLEATERTMVVVRNSERALERERSCSVEQINSLGGKVLLQ